MFLFTEKPRVRQKEKFTTLFELGAFIYLNVSGKKSPELSWVCVCVCLFLWQVCVVYCEHQKQSAPPKNIKGYRRKL